MKRLIPILLILALALPLVRTVADTVAGLLSAG